MAEPHVQRVDPIIHSVPQFHGCHAALRLLEGRTPASDRVIEFVEVIKFELEASCWSGF